ncbi:MAG: ferric reductase-like transmembrane domain-containing protein [Hyphomicrobium sp.]|jgi:predicted ferric reductase|nr:ferric reductase-like transmembrane domain-containing protein [Hyphomicrobium sp.]
MQLLKLKGTFIAATAVVLVLWLLSLPPGAFTGDFWLTRRTLVLGTGVMAFALMSLAMVLAVRPVWFETPLGGLDKFYRLHKWLGISAFVFATAHWVLRLGPSWITRLDLFVLPPRPPRSADTSPGFNIFRDLRHAASEVGEWAFYCLAVLIALALWKRFPYKYFLKSHKLMAVVYLLIVFHSFILMDRSYWPEPIGPVLALLMIFGTGASLMSLFQKIGVSRRAYGKITQIDLHHGNDVVNVTIKLETAWPGHEAGQFAFVDFDDPEAAHPFTISSAWKNDGRLSFTIKALGDYTRTLADCLHVGQAVDIEGPYGRFTFKGERHRQIWIGGGVGITPFIAGLKALPDPDQDRPVPIDLFYATKLADPGFTSQIIEIAQRKGVRFHLLEEKDGFLTLDYLEAFAPDWKDADIWFCGPAGFGQALRRPMLAGGLPASRFHQELFEMR